MPTVINTFNASSPLANTGATVLPYVLIGLLLVVLAIAALLWARHSRRQQAEQAAAAKPVVPPAHTDEAGSTAADATDGAGGAVAADENLDSGESSLGTSIDPTDGDDPATK